MCRPTASTRGRLDSDGASAFPPPCSPDISSSKDAAAPPDRIYAVPVVAAKRALVVLADLSLLLYVLGFLFFRVAELAVLAASFPHQCAATAVAGLLLLLGHQSASASSRRSSRGGFPKRHVVAATSLAALAHLVDVHLPIPPPLERAAGRTVVITGGNSGVGYETARALAGAGATVVLGCRNEGRCADAAGRINAEVVAKVEAEASSGSDTGTVGTAAARGGRAIPLPLDLSSFDSVSSFASDIRSRNLSVDILFNNAGFVPPHGMPVDNRGLDPAFASMHLSHHLLTELLLRDHPSSLRRIVNTSSGTHHLCAVPFAYLPQWLLQWMNVTQSPGCVDEAFLSEGMRSPTDDAAYIQCKAANILHASEVPRRHPEVEAAAIDLGWVGTSIQPFMTGDVSPTSLGWMRSAEVGINPALNALLGPLDRAAEGGARRGGNGGGAVVNPFGRADEPFSYPWWTSRGASGRDLGAARMGALAGKLWEASEDVLRGSGHL